MTAITMQNTFARQVILLHNLENRVTFVFSIYIEYWQIKEHFFALGSFLEIRQVYVIAYVIIYGQWKLKVHNFQDRAFKCNHFLEKNLIPVVNRSKQDARVLIIRKPVGNVSKLPNFIWSFNRLHLYIFFSFAESIKSNILISDSIFIKI